MTQLTVVHPCPGKIIISNFSEKSHEQNDTKQELWLIRHFLFTWHRLSHKNIHNVIKSNNPGGSWTQLSNFTTELFLIHKSTLRQCASALQCELAALFSPWLVLLDPGLAQPQADLQLSSEKSNYPRSSGSLSAQAVAKKGMGGQQMRVVLCVVSCSARPNFICLHE